MAWAAIIGAGIAAAGLINDLVSGSAADERAEEAAALEREQAKQDAILDLLDIRDAITGLKTDINLNEIDQLQARSNISSYQNFLDRYGNYFAAETTTAQAGIKQTELAGKAAYDQMMDALGYSEALAGATGRVAAGSSSAAVTGRARENVVDYVGEDMTLDNEGGLYGLQITSANMQYDQLLLDLEAERQSAAGNLDIWSQTLDTLEENADLLEGSLSDSEEALDDMREWINETFGGWY